jgi:UDP-glucose 4-epimerase
MSTHWSHIVVTGCAGFLGRAVVRALVRDGYRVTGVDDLSRGDGAAGGEATHFVRLDVRDRSAVEALLRNQRPDGVVHLAGWTRVEDERSAPEVVVEVALGGTAALLGAMRAAGVRNLLAASDLAVYGHGDGDLDEATPLAPLARRGRIHAEGEWLLGACAESWGLRPLAMRLAILGGGDAAIGVGEHTPPFSRLVSEAVRAARREDHPFAVHERDGVVRSVDLLHVLDAAEGVLACVRVAERGAGPGAEAGWALNVASGRAVTETELARAVGGAAGRAVPLESRALPAEVPLRAVASSARLRERTGWEPTRSLADIAASAWEAEGSPGR